MKRLYLGLLFIAFSFGSGFQGFTQSNDKVVNEIPQETVRITIADNRLIVENLQKDTVIEIYNIVGRKVAAVKAKAGYGEYLLNLSKGYYIVKVENTVKKVAIK